MSWIEKVNNFLNKGVMTLMNRSSLRKKFAILYIVCVIAPVFVTDTIIINSVYEREKIQNSKDMEHVADLYFNTIMMHVDENMTLANAVDMNNRINTFVNKEYNTPYDYYAAYFDMINGSFLQTIAGLNNNSTVTVYADNTGILDGAFFKRMSSAARKSWYEPFVESTESERVIILYSDDIEEVDFNKRKKFVYIKEMNHNRNGCKKMVAIENDCSALSREMKTLNDKYPMYIICDDYVLFTNESDNIITVDQLSYTKLPAYYKDVDVKGTKLRIAICRDKGFVSNILMDNLYIIISLVLFTIAIPAIALQVMEESIVNRLILLEKAFINEDDKYVFNPIADVDGDDEIANLMRRYNEMVSITNDLLKTIYMDKLKEQENDIARKNAELLALQSQINPHFLFNALESIRMHSLLKGETETSMMVGKLAVMQRQNVEWGQDFVSIRKEMESIEAYLYLQVYRFGDRLTFEIDVDEDVERYLIPKLTIVTFVENACVHGIESKASPGWIFVNAHKDDKYLIIEVEDTGGGMEEDEVKDMLVNINNVSIDTLKEKKHVGILNACLRLKMITDDTVIFKIDSEAGVGMTIEIKILLEKLNILEEKENA